jgi:hypothetical protein
MKKHSLIIAIIIICAVLFMSCSSEENGAEYIPENIENSEDILSNANEAEENNHLDKNEAEIIPVRFTSRMSDDVWASANMEHSRFQTVEDFIAQADLYITAISEFVSGEDWFERYRRNDNIAHIEYRLTDGISRVTVANNGYQVNVYLRQQVFEHDLAPIAHEISHVIVPFNNRSLSLNEGLASYIQHKFGQNPSLFNWGIDPHILANLFFTYAEEAYNTIFPVIGTKSPLQNEFINGELRQIFYVLSHSFAKYLIDTFGIENFMNLHESNDLINDYYTFYGKSFEEIKSEWHNVLESSPSMTAEEYSNHLIELYEKHNFQIN